jgi:hypothetical protein
MKACPWCEESIEDTAVVCQHCNRKVASGTIAMIEGPPRTGKHPIVLACWAIAALAAIAGGIEGWLDFQRAESAPQQAVAAAFGCFIAIVPYVFARAVSELGSSR